MAQVTVELRNLLKTNFELFDFEYQFDDPIFKKKLEQAVIDFYYNYEIGQETPDVFKQRFKSRWLRNIDYYNKLYNTTLLEYNPLVNSKMSEAMEQLSNSNSTQNSDSESTSNGTTKSSDITNNENTTTNNLTTTTVNSASTDSNEKTSDYPQQSIRGGDYANGERVSDTLTSSEGSSTNTGTVKNVGSSNGSGTSESTDKGISKSSMKNTNNSSTSYAKTIEGLTGITYQDLIIKERNNLLRIENMVIEEMKPCFLLVY